MNQEQAERLKQLAAYLRTVDPDHFNMEWYGISNARALSQGSLAELHAAAHEALPAGHACGTAGCALGYATNVWPEVFALTTPGGCGKGRFKWGLQFNTGDNELGWLDISYMSSRVQEFFGLSAAEARHLFNGDSAQLWAGVEPGARRTPLEEAEVIEEVVHNHGY